jgi:hypothetical protein
LLVRVRDSELSWQTHLLVHVIKRGNPSTRWARRRRAASPSSHVGKPTHQSNNHVMIFLSCERSRSSQYVCPIESMPSPQWMVLLWLALLTTFRCVQPRVERKNQASAFVPLLWLKIATFFSFFFCQSIYKKFIQ